VFSAEMISMLLSATLAGSAAYLAVDAIYGSLNEKMKRELGYILFGSAGLLAAMFIGELVFAEMHSEYAEKVVEILAFGEVAPWFWGGMFLAFIVPMVLVGIANEKKRYEYAILGSLSALVGLWLIKHAWLIAPQSLPLS